MTHKPEILAPAGDRSSFLAAVAAGADAVYVGLKSFSARMQAANFSIKELAAMVEFAADRDCKLYVALNSMLKPGDVESAGRLMDRLQRVVKPAALIVQDLACLELARQTGFAGELHVSTLANVSHPAGLRMAKQFGATRVVLPRELNVDEIKLMADACPPEMDLEVFIHGALCYCVSGRCYWSSYMGGLSGLRGRCVQPCRRMYQQKNRKGRFFSCLDLSLDVLVKALLDIDRVKTWKIEGRKKGPHYVYYTTTAYKLLRDNPNDAKAKKHAVEILEKALGRQSTHYTFLPQRSHSPVPADTETSSGMLASKISKTPEGKHFIKTRFELLPGDLLRVGYEDQPWHQTVKVRRGLPKGGRLDIKVIKRKGPAPGTPVFLVDRREPELMKMISELDKELEKVRLPKSASKASHFAPEMPAPKQDLGKSKLVNVRRKPEVGGPRAKQHKGEPKGDYGLWFSPITMKTLSRTLYGRTWWWLPPVLWPSEEEIFKRQLNRLVSQGGKRFVCNAPWQLNLFDDVDKVFPVAGPFCNLANPLAIELLREQGFKMAIVSPEMSEGEILSLPAESSLPLGIVTQGYWPSGISRVDPVAKQSMPMESPKGESFWTRKYAENLWIYPTWPMDLSEKISALEQAGYVLFINLDEPRPKTVPEPKRTSTFNWSNRLL